MVGEVAGLGLELGWVDPRPRPLAGRTIAVTRARAQSSDLAVRLRALGAEVLETPTIRIVPREVVLPALGDFDLICLTSPNGVEILFDRLGDQGEDARVMAGATVAAIGPGTARALAAHGILADVVPERFVAESLAESLEGYMLRRALIVRAAQARDVLPDSLSRRGVEVEVLALYDTVAEPLAPEQLAAAGSADYITFTSSSTVRFYLEAGEIGPRTRVASIGPVTSQTLRDHGIEPDVEAEVHDIDGLVAAVRADAVALAS